MMGQAIFLFFEIKIDIKLRYRHKENGYDQLWTESKWFAGVVDRDLSHAIFTQYVSLLSRWLSNFFFGRDRLWCDVKVVTLDLFRDIRDLGWNTHIIRNPHKLSVDCGVNLNRQYESAWNRYTKVEKQQIQRLSELKNVWDFLRSLSLKPCLEPLQYTLRS